MAREEFLKLLVSNQPNDEVVNHKRQRVIAAEAFIQRFLLRHAVARASRGKDQRKDQN
jgi:hypothetical protein